MATLPDTPQGHELEEFVAALLQSTGHYVEKNIDNPNILELDVVATDYRAHTSRPRVFEVKGKGARLEDIFKLVGRMTYLGIDEGAFVTTHRPRDERDVEWFRGVCDKTNIRFVTVPNLDAAPQTFDEHGFGKADELRHAVWRFSYALERIYIKAVRDLRPTVVTARAAIDYYNLVNSGVFLTPDYSDKVRKIYGAYQEHPGLTRELADEMAEDGNGAPLVNAALRRGTHVQLHATMYFEHRARLSLLKAAADYLLAGGALDLSDPENIRVDFGITDLPSTFLRGLGWLENQPKYWLYPLFWQNYLWGWGGILPDEHRDSVLEGIAEASGLTLKEAEIAIHAFDQLFPIEQGWHRHFSNADYGFVLLTPMHFQGLGVFHQLRLAGPEKYGDWVTTGQYTERDFVTRNNAAVRLMEEATAQVAAN